MKKIQYKNELFIPHKKFSLEELAERGVTPSSKTLIDSKRYILCELQYQNRDASQAGYYSRDNEYHAVYDTKTKEFVMFNEETESPMGPWLVLTEQHNVLLPKGLNAICYSIYDYDYLDDTNDTWWYESQLYGVFDDDGYVARGTVCDYDGVSSIYDNDDFIRFDHAGSGMYKDTIDWVLIKGKLVCSRAFAENAELYTIIDNPETKTSDQADRIVYVMCAWDQQKCKFFAVDSKTGKQSVNYPSYERLLMGEDLYSLSDDASTRFYPGRISSEGQRSFIVKKQSELGDNDVKVDLPLIGYNAQHDLYIYSKGKGMPCYIRFAENGDNPDMDIEIPSEFDLSQPISLVDLVEYDPYNFAKLPTFEFGSKVNIEGYLDAIVRHLDAKAPTVEDGVKDRSLIKQHEKYVESLAIMVEDKIEQEKAKIRAQEQECWDAKKASEPKEPNYDSSLQECIDRERIARKLKESKERIVKRTKKELDKISKTASEIKTYGDDIL